MRHWTRALTTLAAAVAAGCLLWYVPHFNRWTTGGYWAVMALMVAAGVVIGVSQLHGRDGSPAASFLLAFLPVFVAATWVLLASQPQGNWVRDHARSWSDDIGIGNAVSNLGHHVAVVAFGLGVVFGLTFELKMIRRRPKPVAVPPAPVASAPIPEEPEPVDTQPGEPEAVTVTGTADAETPENEAPPPATPPATPDGR